MVKFEGIPPAGLRFLKQLKKNNDRDWFVPRKSEYERVLKEPMLALIEDIGRGLAKVAPEIRVSPRSLLRIYRDVRFSKNKDPYKTNIAATFDMAGYPKGVSSPGLYLSIEPGDVFIGGGLYMPDSRQLKRIRYSIETKSDSFLSIVENRAFKKRFGALQGETLKRAPAGYSPDHPMIEHLKRKHFFVGQSFPDTACTKPGFAKEVVEAYVRIMPLARWLRDASR